MSKALTKISVEHPNPYTKIDRYTYTLLDNQGKVFVVIVDYTTGEAAGCEFCLGAETKFHGKYIENMRIVSTTKITEEEKENEEKDVIAWLYKYRE